MSDTHHAPETSDTGEKLMPHSYDGIREYDKRLPNWWLWTFYLAMIFSFAYWFYMHRSEPGVPADVRVKQKVAELAMKTSAGGANLTDDQLWEMSGSPDIVAAGKETFTTTCVSCHGANLKGGIGFNLVDAEWVHGGKPTEIMATVINGVVEKGMPTWGPVLGSQRVAEVTAFILSHHNKGPDNVATPK